MSVLIWLHFTSYILQRRKKAKKNIVVPAPGPRTPSRANANVVAENESTQGATATDNEPTGATKTIQKEAKQTSKAAEKRVKPTCSKLLRQTSEFQTAGSLSAYLTLREQQQNGLAQSTEQDDPEAIMEEIAPEENDTGK